MKRRQFVAAALTSLATPFASAAVEVAPNFTRFVKPDTSTDEGGLWAMMDREEGKLRRSPFVMRDTQFKEYVQDIACRLGGDHCPDIRVHLVNNRYFNASMAPNGMLQVWSGLMLRVDNEAQLAAVLAHEIGHYMERHSLASLRDLKSRAAFANFMAVLGVAGLIGQLLSVGGMYSFSRDHERHADQISLALMAKAGYDPREAALIWRNLLSEVKADPETDPTKESVLFATHPPMEERQTTLAEMASKLPTGVTNEEAWIKRTAPFRRAWLNEEVKRAKPAESLVLLKRLIERSPKEADFPYARAEVYRLRAKEGDADLALKDYQTAQSLGNEPAETHRGLGMIYRERKQVAQAKTSFARYLELAPEASDFLMIKSYVEESAA